MAGAIPGDLNTAAAFDGVNGQETSPTGSGLNSDLAPLYLYVPVGKGDEGLSLCRQMGVPVVGIRTWRYIAGYEEPEINDHYTVPSGPEDLLPKFLRPS